ncbi:TIGR04104 family putative zinc finger protein [Oceanobacillus halotolerans]|uniref:TIGR04104 family putative zinc finger protein n=1 Tax=Oceanobacillus halotolerans TaxID=2663380 RepID=UPI0013D7C0C2|nr:TIGR04104 family putative zinc finger protein [Oceanobacillus halotolerans]
MPDCPSCGKQWHYKDTLKQVLRRKKQCPYCDRAVYVTTKGRWRESTLQMVPLLVWLPLVSFGVAPVIYIPIVITIFVLMYFIIPFYTELSKDEEPIY